MNQPTVQEGPNEKSYWYHKEKNDHRFLPFVVSLVTILGGATSVAPHHFYWHFNQLYPHVNSTETRLKFCPRVILTVDFYNSCHTDKNDLDPKQTDQMVTKLKEIITIFHHLTADGLKVVPSRTSEAVKSLAHLRTGIFACQQPVAISISSKRQPRLRFINGSCDQALELRTALGTTGST